MKKHVVTFLFLLPSMIPDIVYAGSSGGGEPTPISIRERTEMNFAVITVMLSGDVVTITPSGAISSANGSFFMGTPDAASFSAQGDKNAAASISFSSGDTLTGPGAPMPLGSFTHDAGVTPTFTSSKKLDFNVGASLTINPSQIGGSYSGQYTVTVDYQ